MMKIFITGGSGFIGRNLKEQLNNKYSIFAPSSQELDLLDEAKVKEYLKKHNFDVVIHTATWNATRNSKKDTSKVFESNLKMFFNIARQADLCGKIIYYGSGAAYDMRHYIPRMPESYFDTHVPADEYGFSKYIMAKYTENAKNIYNLRLFGVFGKYEDWEIRFISNACCKAVWDLPITIRQNVYFDYLFIEDLANITDWFINNNPDEKTYNVCTGKAIDLLAFANNVVKISDKDIDVIVKKDGLGREYSGDNSKLLSHIEDYTFSGIDKYIKQLYGWYLEEKNSIDKNLLLVDK